MVKIKKVEFIESLNELKQQYMDRTTFALDGMWMAGFVPKAVHYGLYNHDELIGFFCINDQKYLLQFHITLDYYHQAMKIFDDILNPDGPLKVQGAFASTAEPNYLSLCMDHFHKFKVHTLMYQKIPHFDSESSNGDRIQMPSIKRDQLSETVAFAHSSIGAPEEWLTNYYSNLIDRGELYGFWQQGHLVATGECRAFDQYQMEYADLGFIVGTNLRGKGLGTRVFKFLIKKAESKNLKPICSTEKGNLGAQIAIARAGMFASNRIIQFDRN